MANERQDDSSWTCGIRNARTDFHAPFIYADPHFTLKKVYKRTSNKSKQAYPSVEIVRTFDELLTEDIDLVLISTSNPYHVPMAAQAKQEGVSR